MYLVVCVDVVNPLSTACPEGWYGENCQFQCQCAHRQECDVKTGQCTCQTGYQGVLCSEGMPERAYTHANIHTHARARTHTHAHNTTQTQTHFELTGTFELL